MAVRAGGDVREPGHVRVAAVGSDDQAPAQRAARPTALGDLDARDPVVLGHDGRHRRAEHQLHARRLGGHPADDRVERLAADVHARRQRRVAAHLDRSPPRPHAQPRASGARRLHRLQQPEPLERGHRRGLDEVPADALEGVGIGAALD